EQIQEMAERNRDTSEVLDVVDGDFVVGVVWLADVSGGELVVYDIELEDPARVGGLVPLLVDRARTAGARMVGVGITPGDPSRTALGDQPGFVPRATNMALRLDRSIADPGEVGLRPMTDAEFDEFLASQVDGYAVELAAAGMTEE